MDELEAKKRASVGQLLFQAARLFNEQALARVRAAGAPNVGVAHTRLLPFIDFVGVRPTELARRAGISKQAVGQLVDDLVQAGVVARERDPDDRRATRVRFTERGREALLHGLSLLAALEDELAAEVGRDRIDRLRVDLAALVEVLVARS